VVEALIKDAMAIDLLGGPSLKTGGFLLVALGAARDLQDPGF